MKRPTGHVEYREDTSISYSASGRNPPLSWVVIVDGHGVVDRDKTYAWAAIHLAHELAWRDPEILKLGEKLETRKKEIYNAHLSRLTESRPDKDSTDPQLGRVTIYNGDDGNACGVCYTHKDHETIEIAHAHGCTR